KTHQGIEEEEARPELGEGGAQALEILTSIEPEARDRDHVEIGIKKLDLAGPRDRLDALTDERKRIFCEVDERESGILDWEVSERGAATCNAERHVEPEPGFAGFRGATEDTNGLTRPETVDEEASRLLFDGNGRDVENRQRGGGRLEDGVVSFVHERHPLPLLFVRESPVRRRPEASPMTSKKTFSSMTARSSLAACSRSSCERSMRARRLPAA